MSRADGGIDPPPAAGLVAAPVGRTPRRRPLTPQTVLALQGHRAYPSVSLLLTTRPGPQLDPRDAARLDALLAEARHRLAAERTPGADAVLAALGEVSTPLAGPVERAVALYASAVTVARVDLPVEVVDRTVVDPTFATRDLVRALHRTPRHVVLLLDADEARLFDGAGDVLTPVRSAFPLVDPHHRVGEPPRLAFQQTVDRALGAHLRVHPAPLVLAGSEPALSSFRWTSRNSQRLAGTVRGEFGDVPGEALRARVREVLEQYLLSRRAEALALLAQRDAEGRAAHGMQEAWTAARWERPEMLMVEQGFFHPARIGADGETLHPADDPHAPDVVDDVVDELIELVLARGGWVALLDDGTLPAGTGVALTLHRR
jgi:hypothetical protein